MSNDWNWYSESAKESLVIPRVDAVAIYENEDGEIVIRQQGVAGDEDNVIIFPKSQCSEIITALNNALG